MTTAYVLSGGASLGSVQIGMLLAPEEAGVVPDMIVGTSVGAINGSWVASGRSADGLASIWRQMRRADLFPLRPLVGLGGFIDRSSHFVPNSGLRRLLEHNVRFANLEDAPIPLTVIAADALSGEEVAIDSGPAIEAGATDVWVLSTGYSCGLSEPPSGAVATAMHSVALLMQQRLEMETRDRTYPVPVHLVPPPCPITVPLGLHFHPAVAVR